MGLQVTKCTDHLNNEFKSQHKMCKYWEVLDSTYIARLKSGMTQSEALEKKTNRVKVKDHLKNKFDSFTDMCIFWGANNATVQDRLNRGWGLDKALTEPVDMSHGSYRICTDHLGNKYKSVSEMCVRYEIGRTLYRYRITHGWTQEKALTTKAKIKVVR